MCRQLPLPCPVGDKLECAPHMLLQRSATLFSREYRANALFVAPYMRYAPPFAYPRLCRPPIVFRLTTSYTGIEITYICADWCQPFFGAMGCTSAIVFTCFGAAYGTAKAGVGISAMGVLRPDLIVKSTFPGATLLFECNVMMRVLDQITYRF